MLKKMAGFNMLLKNFVLLFLFIIISASLLFSSSAGRVSRFTGNSEKEVGTTHVDQEQGLSYISERLLRANTKDYGRYDPAPALVKPPFKLIPN